MKKNYLLAAFLFVSLITNAQSVSLSLFKSGLDNPVFLTNCGDDRIFIVEQPGTIRVVDASGNLLTRPFLNITGPVKYGGEQGLLGLAFPADYLTSGVFYVYYTADPYGYNTIARYQVSATDPDSAVASSGQIIISIYDPASNHNGGTIQFSPTDGYLYFASGDGGPQGDPGNRAQNLDTLLGKVLRFDVSGGGPGYAIPCDNPYVDVPGRDEVWANGLRNPYRWSFDRWNGDMYIGDVGQGLYEEANYQPAGAGGYNYGWRCYEGLHAYNTANCQPQSSYISPFTESTHADGNCSVIGGYVYRGAEYSGLFGKYFYTDYCLSDIKQVTKSGSTFTETNLGALSGPGSYSGWGEDKYGQIYLTSLGGSIYHLNYSDSTPIAFISDLDTIQVCDNEPIVLHTPQGRNFNYSWTQDGVGVGGSTSDLPITQSGLYQVTVYNAAFVSATSNPVYVNVNVVPTPQILALDSLYCDYDASITLTANPIGGLFHIDGNCAASSTFDPAALGAGFHTVEYTYTTPEGCVSSAIQGVVVDQCLNAGNVLSERNIKLYPNPNNGAFALNISVPNAGNVSIELADISGKIVWRENKLLSSGLNKIQFTQKDLTGGVYFVKVSNDSFSKTMRMIKN